MPVRTLLNTPARVTPQHTCDSVSSLFEKQPNKQRHKSAQNSQTLHNRTNCRLCVVVRSARSRCLVRAEGLIRSVFVQTPQVRVLVVFSLVSVRMMPDLVVAAHVAALLLTALTDLVLDVLVARAVVLRSSIRNALSFPDFRLYLLLLRYFFQRWSVPCARTRTTPDPCRDRRPTCTPASAPTSAGCPSTSVLGYPVPVACSSSSCRTRTCPAWSCSHLVFASFGGFCF